jgi:deoxycytidine triphosphate deaminase
VSEQFDEKLLWLDPDPHVGPGMLLSDRIRFYAEAVGMIQPFNEAQLKGASYRLTLGDLCYHDGHFDYVKNLLQQELVIEPNSFVIVTMAEVLRLPFYIAARFDLKIDMIYQGLLLGTGPQVDPGFHGNLSCPIHNISSRQIRIKLGASFATIDFQKTTPFAQGGNVSTPFTGIESLDQLRQLSDTKGLKGYDGNPLCLFPLHKLKRLDIHDYLREATGASSPSPGIVSSVQAVKKDVEEAKGSMADSKQKVNDLIADVKRNETIRRWLEVAVAFLITGLLFGALYFYIGRYSDAIVAANQAQARFDSQAKHDMEQRELLRKTVDELRARIETLESAAKSKTSR